MNYPLFRNYRHELAVTEIVVKPLDLSMGI